MAAVILSMLAPRSIKPQESYLQQRLKLDNQLEVFSYVSAIFYHKNLCLLQASIIDILLKSFFKDCPIMYTLREVIDKVAKKEISPSEAEIFLKLCAVDEVRCPS